MPFRSSNIAAFLEVFRCGSISDAAEMLALTQTAVTHRIRNLEGDLETSLFIRSKRGMSPTEAGKKLYYFAQQFAQIENEALGSLMHLSQWPQLRIIGPSSLLRTRILPIQNELLDGFRGLRVHLLIPDRPGPDALLNGQADIVLLREREPSGQIKFVKLPSETYRLYGPKAWRRRALKSIVEDEQLINFSEGDKIAERILRKRKLRLPPQYKTQITNNVDVMLAQVGRGLGYCALSDEHVQSSFARETLVSLHTTEIQMPVYCAWLEQTFQPQFLSRAIELVLKHA